MLCHFTNLQGGGPRVVVSTAAFHSGFRSVFGSRSRRFERNKMFLPHLRMKLSIVGSLRDREVACSASDRQGSNFESCVWRTVSSHSSHHPQEVLLAQFSLYVHKGGLKPDSFHFHFQTYIHLCIVLQNHLSPLRMCCRLAIKYKIRRIHVSKCRQCNISSTKIVTQCLACVAT